MELDDTLAVAHSALAAVLFLTEFNFPEAEREYRRTLELDPSNSEAMSMYAHVLLILRRPDEAMPQAERAVAIAPLEADVRMLYSATLIFTRRYDEALAQANELLRLQPGHPGGQSALVPILHMKQRYADAIAAEAVLYETGGWQDVAEELKKGYAESGYAEALRRATEVVLAKHGNEPGAAREAAINYAMAGDRARSLDWLEKAYADRDPTIPYIGCWPIYDPLRAEPRFQALLRQMNLPQ